MPVKIDFEPAAAAIDFEPDSSGIDFEPEQPEAGLSETTLAQLNQDIRLTEGGRQNGQVRRAVNQPARRGHALLAAGIQAGGLGHWRGWRGQYPARPVECRHAQAVCGL